MGFNDLIAKKSFVCERCGKEYQARIAIGARICQECSAREKTLKKDLLPYIRYAEDMHLPSYSAEQLEQIAEHREQILKKHTVTEGISKEELQTATSKYKKLTHAEADNVLLRTINSVILSTFGSAYSKNFFCPVNYEGAIVDAEDVYAVGITRESLGLSFEFSALVGDNVLCVLFTNDPYIPVFPFVYGVDPGVFGRLISGGNGRKDIVDFFETMCPNLTYPVQDLRSLEEQINNETTVKGNVDRKLMLEKIQEAFSGEGVFKNMFGLVTAQNELYDKYGYIQEINVNPLFNKNTGFWEEKARHLVNSGAVNFV